MAKRKTEKLCNGAGHVARARKSWVKSLPSVLMFNPMRSMALLLSQHGLCLVTGAVNIISEMCGQGLLGHLVKMTSPGNESTQILKALEKVCVRMSQGGREKRENNTPRENTKTTDKLCMWAKGKLLSWGSHGYRTKGLLFHRYSFENILRRYSF